MITLENGFIKAQFQEKGAELISLYSLSHQLEYLWSGDSQYWGRHAPVLFPVVGRLKDDTYTYQGKEYSLGQHGFARDKEFTVVEKSAHHVVFQLTSSPETLAVYPFAFVLRIRYQLLAAQLTVTYEVVNPSKTQALVFGLGAHPAFRVPLKAGETFKDYQLTAKPQETYQQLALVAPYLDLEQARTFDFTQLVSLASELFAEDTLILATPEKTAFTLVNPKTHLGVEVAFEGFPFTGFWTANPQEMPFVCIEPWCGIADTLDASGDFSEKFGNNILEPEKDFQRSFTISIL